MKKPPWRNGVHQTNDGKQQEAAHCSCQSPCQHRWCRYVDGSSEKWNQKQERMGGGGTALEGVCVRRIPKLKHTCGHSGGQNFSNTALLIMPGGQRHAKARRQDNVIWNIDPECQWVWEPYLSLWSWWCLLWCSSCSTSSREGRLQLIIFGSILPPCVNAVSIAHSSRWCEDTPHYTPIELSQYSSIERQVYSLLAVLRKYLSQVIVVTSSTTSLLIK